MYPVGETSSRGFRFCFNFSLNVDFRGARATSDAGVLTVRDLDERLGLSELILDNLPDGRRLIRIGIRVARFIGRQSVLLSGLFMIMPWAAAQTQSGTRSPVVDLFIADRDGNAPAQLRPHDFVPNISGHILVVTAIRQPQLKKKPRPRGTYVPTRMLSIVSKPNGRLAAIAPTLMRALTPLWSRGWQVSFMGSDGGETGYASSGPQLLELSSRASASPSGTEKALVSLGSFRGRRILLYETGSFGKQVVPPEPVLQMAREATAEIFAIDGGTPNYVGDDGGASGPPPGENAAGDANVNATIGRGRGGVRSSSRSLFDFTKGVYLEVDDSGAIRNALSKADGFFELHIRLPSDLPIDPQSVVSLEIKRSASLAIFGEIHAGNDRPALHVTLKN
jgi:hypothetical protein